MQLVQLRSHAEVRRFLFFWGALTAVYIGATLYRLIALRQSPAISTYAGFSAVAAVWFAVLETVMHRRRFALATIASLFTSVTLNATAITRTVLSGRGFPVARLLFTALLLIVLFSKTKGNE